MQLQVETAIYKDGAIGYGISDASTKATSFITYINQERGIQVHDRAAIGTEYDDFVQINSNDISMWRDNKKMMSLDDSLLTFYNGQGTLDIHKLAQFGSAINIYKPGTGEAAVTIDSNGAVFNGRIVATRLTIVDEATVEGLGISNVSGLQTALNTEAIQRKAVYAISATNPTDSNKTTISGTPEGFVLYNGATVTIKFNNANATEEPTLNVNNTGAYEIRSYTGAPLTAVEYTWPAEATITFTYIVDGNESYWYIQDSGALQAKADAAASALEASGYADNASGYADNASDYADTATQQAGYASGYASDASHAKDEAEAAQGAAELAQGQAETAAGQAAGSAGQAASSAGQAAGSALEASGYASDASGYADAAAGSATQAAGSATNAAASAIAAAEVMGGFTILWNYSNFNTSTAGQAYICGYDSSNGQKLDDNGWVKWYGVKQTIPKQLIDTTNLPTKIPIYIIYHINSNNNSGNYVIWYSGGWKGIACGASISTLDVWTWSDSNDIILGKFVKPDSTAPDQELVEYDLFNPPWGMKQLTTNTTTSISYITDSNSKQGFVVKPKDSSGNDFLQLNSTAIEFFKNSTTDSALKITNNAIRIGSEWYAHTTADTSGLHIFSGKIPATQTEAEQPAKELAFYGSIARIGKVDESKVKIDYQGITIYDKEHSINEQAFFLVKDTRDTEGKAIIRDQFTIGQSEIDESIGRVIICNSQGNYGTRQRTNTEILTTNSHNFTPELQTIIINYNNDNLQSTYTETIIAIADTDSYPLTYFGDTVSSVTVNNVTTTNYNIDDNNILVFSTGIDDSEQNVAPDAGDIIVVTYNAYKYSSDTSYMIDNEEYNITITSNIDDLQFIKKADGIYFNKSISSTDTITLNYYCYCYNIDYFIKEIVQIVKESNGTRTILTTNDYNWDQEHHIVLYVPFSLNDILEVTYKIWCVKSGFNVNQNKTISLKVNGQSLEGIEVIQDNNEESYRLFIFHNNFNLNSTVNINFSVNEEYFAVNNPLDSEIQTLPYYELVEESYIRTEDLSVDPTKTYYIQSNYSYYLNYIPATTDLTVKIDNNTIASNKWLLNNRTLVLKMTKDEIENTYLTSDHDPELEVTFYSTDSNIKVLRFGLPAVTDQTYGSYSVTMGSSLQNYSFAGAVFGSNNENYRQKTLISGSYNKNYGESSFISGRGNINSGSYSIIAGLENTNTSQGGIVFGYNNECDGKWSYIEGYNNKIKAPLFYGHVEGGYNSIEGTDSSYAHVQNLGNIATKRAQTVIGTYNLKDTSTSAIHSGGLTYGQYAFIIGNGTETTRSNALTVDWQGNLETAGNINTKGTLTSKSITASGSITATGSLKIGGSLTIGNHDSAVGSIYSSTFSDKSIALDSSTWRTMYTCVVELLPGKWLILAYAQFKKDSTKNTICLKRNPTKATSSTDSRGTTYSYGFPYGTLYRIAGTVVTSVSSKEYMWLRAYSGGGSNTLTAFGIRAIRLT